MFSKSNRATNVVLKARDGVLERDKPPVDGLEVVGAKAYDAVQPL